MIARTLLCKLAAAIEAVGGERPTTVDAIARVRGQYVA